ncbi:MAG: bacterial Ig-like domain-containing protein [Streptococcaceae bacterium]|jgi:hypothetical protein|nr:bacterial Ig-like domain-containing protein [Streptococcaceae bacterium]
MTKTKVKQTAFRVWKSGKTWVFAAATVVVLTTGVAMGQRAAASVNLLAPQTTTLVSASAAATTASSTPGYLYSASSVAPSSAASSYQLSYADSAPVTLNVKNATVAQGATWSPAAGFISGTDVNGYPMTVAELSVAGNVDTSTPGVYPVTYQYAYTTSQTTHIVSQKVYVVVTNAAVKINATDAFLYATQRYNQKLSLLHVEDSNGKTISPSQVSYKVIDQTLGASNTEIYTLEFSYTDSNGKTGVAVGKFYALPETNLLSVVH